MEVDINRESFDSLKTSDKLIIIDFWAPWCGPCRMMSKTISNLSEKYSDNAIIGKCNVEDNEEFSEDFDIRNLPTIVFIKNGEVLDKVSGLKSEDELASKILELQ
jgi:thioredoxin 1